MHSFLQKQQQIKRTHPLCGRDIQAVVKRLSGSISVAAPAELLKISQVKHIVVVGSSGTGKTTLVNSVRILKGIHVPQRYITRPIRKNEDSSENRHVSMKYFEMLVSSGKISLQWTRNMEGDRKEKYGFAFSNDADVQILSGNNALYNNLERVEPKGTLKSNTLWVGVYAPEEVLINRLTQRSPDLVNDRVEEFAYRMNDKPNNMFDHVHLIVNNFGEHEHHAVIDFSTLARKVAG